MFKKSDSNNNIGAFALLIFILIGYTFLKRDYFNLPFYWDEAWSYSKAVFQMFQDGPTLNPIQVDQQVFRGHPLFFYFLTSSLATLTSWSLWSMHLWMYILSVLGVFGFYFVIKYSFDSSSALIGSTILLASEMFFIQSSMLLPEVIIAFLFIFSIHFFMARKYAWYFLAASALVLTKESGLMLFPVLGLFVIWEEISERRKLRDFINNIIIYLLPFFIFCAFMLMQKIKWGWYVFPDHVAFINFNFNHTIDKLELFFDFVFFQEGRIYMSGLAVLVLLVISLVRKYNQPLKKEQNEILIICFGFTLIYSYFSAVNFYTQRYLLSLLPIYALVMSAAFYRLKNMHLVKKVLSVLIIGLGFYLYSMGSNNSLGDTSQGHKSMVLLHKSVISDFVLPNRDASFSVGFLFSEYLKYPETGYVNQTDPSDFKLVNINDADFLVTSSINLMEDRLAYCRENGECNLVYSKEEGLAWVKVYETKY